MPRTPLANSNKRRTPLPSSLEKKFSNLQRKRNAQSSNDYLLKENIQLSPISKLLNDNFLLSPNLNG